MSTIDWFFNFNLTSTCKEALKLELSGGSLIIYFKTQSQAEVAENELFDLIENGQNGQYDSILVYHPPGTTTLLVQNMALHIESSDNFIKIHKAGEEFTFAPDEINFKVLHSECKKLELTHEEFVEVRSVWIKAIGG